MLLFLIYVENIDFIHKTHSKTYAVYKKHAKTNIKMLTYLYFKCNMYIKKEQTTIKNKNKER
jgi:hypothetical protein